mmetsp:Transcript_25101/g.33281  ORF Transcript_25101/g.33281 Transcript_25101/m.33281 type:complete len:146 (-) Transcript_25101:207-644(-)
MTYLSIVSPLTSGVGKVELGDQNLTELTVGDIKDKIETRHVKTPANKQKLWWMGYLLDDDSLSIEKACVGVNPGESVDKDAENLIIFMTLACEDKAKENGEMKEEEENQSLSSLRRRLRTNSFDMEQIRSKFRQQKEQINWCSIS